MHPHTSSPRTPLLVLFTCIYAACLSHGALQYIDNTDASIKYTGSSWSSLIDLPGSFFNNTAAYADSSGMMAQVTFIGKSHLYVFRIGFLNMVSCRLLCDGIRGPDVRWINH